MSEDEGAARDPWWQRNGFPSEAAMRERMNEDDVDRQRSRFDPTNYQKD